MGASSRSFISPNDQRGTVILVLENEVDPDTRYFVPEIVRYLPDEVTIHDAVHEGGRPSFRDIDGVVLAGSTAGVYDADEHSWIAEEKTFVHDLLTHQIPTLGICFGHQLVNDALGGRIEHQGLKAELVEANLRDDPLFESVSSTIPAVHGDVVVKSGSGMESIASVENYEFFAARHADAPIWTIQYHPEFTARLRERIARDFGWRENDHSFEDVTASRTLSNFSRLVDGVAESETNRNRSEGR